MTDSDSEDKYRTVYRVWHSERLVGEYDARYYAESVRDNEEDRVCEVYYGGDCGMVRIQTVEINDETGEETDVT